jgi:hypothetical protein
MSGAVPWWANSLLSTLLALVVAGFAVSFDRRKTVNQELVRKRIAVYEQIAPLLNDIWFFAFSAGAPLALTPPEVVQRKTELDRLIALYAPLFSERLAHTYWHFDHAIFDATQGWNEPAKLKLKLFMFKHGRADWPAEWDRLFVAQDDDQSEHDALVAFLRHYHALMDQFAVEIGARNLGLHWWTRYKKRRRGL